MASIVEVAHATDGAPGKLAAPAPVARAMPEWSDKEKAKIRRVFDECDADHSGTVSFAEITRGLAKDKELARILGIPKEAATASGAEDLKAIFVGLDVDASGELDFDEFGLFFAERVEILRYLPGADDDDKFCVMTESAAHLSPNLAASFESKLAAVEPKVDGLAAAMLAQLPAAVKHFLEPSAILKDARARGKSLAAAGLTQVSLDAYAAAMLSALADALGDDAFTSAHSEAYGKCVRNLCDMYRLGAEDAQKAEREIKAAAIEAAKAKLAAEKLAATEAAAKADADAVAIEEAKTAAIEAAKAKLVAEKEAAQTALAAAKAAAEEAARMAQAAIDAADAAEKAAIAELTEKAEADKALAVEAKKAKEAEAKAAEVAKKEAEKAAADAAKACELANKKRKEEDARRAKEREAAAKKAAKDKSKKTTAELQEEEAAKLERLAKALEEQARREYEAARAPLTLQPLESYAVDGAVPDKGSTWQYPTQSDGWFRIHNTIRAEMTKLAAALDACAATGEPLPAWKVDAIKSYWSLHSALVRAHHAHEDDIFYPLLATRCALPPKLEIVHGDVLELSAAVDLAVNALEPGADLVPLVSAFDAYKASMEPHLAEEEAVCVPLMRAYFSFKEIAEVMAPMMKKMDPLVMGAFVHHQGSKDQFMKFMKQEKIPAIAWYADFKSMRTKYRAAQEAVAQALLTGVEPAQGKPAKTGKKDLADAMRCGLGEWAVPIPGYAPISFDEPIEKTEKEEPEPEPEPEPVPTVEEETAQEPVEAEGAEEAAEEEAIAEEAEPEAAEEEETPEAPAAAEEEVSAQEEKKEEEVSFA
jgi:hypothetical protein